MSGRIESGPPAILETCGVPGTRRSLMLDDITLDGLLAEFATWLKGAMPGERHEQVILINGLRRLIHDVSPFAGEPVDLVEWVPAGSVEANDYNPNSVAPPEMELLRLSIMADGYTQPIVTNEEEDTR